LYCQVFAVFETNAGSEALTKYKTPSPKYQVQVQSAKYKAQSSKLKVQSSKFKDQSSKPKVQRPKTKAQIFLRKVYRIGIGTDTHRLIQGRPLILGGVHVASDRGGDGHSDADALLHAIADAILGALCEGDLGVHFPDNDPQWKDADSLQLLSRVMWLTRERGAKIINVDTTVSLENPKLRPYVLSMREHIADILAVEVGCVSVKAKTGEGLGFVGQGLAVTAQAVVLMKSAGPE